MPAPSLRFARPECREQAGNQAGVDKSGGKEGWLFRLACG